jgi:flavin reductase (DIM6/NTAB) family NADH-FMN oxidoreductase RutF
MKQAVSGNLLSPLPVVLVGVLVEGRPHYLVIGYISPFDFGKHVFFSMYKGRYTSLGVHENNTFSVNIPSDDMIAAVNICGSKSGREVDKSALFDTFFGELKTASMITESPPNLECEVAEVLDYGQNEGIDAPSRPLRGKACASRLRRSRVAACRQTVGREGE